MEYLIITAVVFVMYLRVLPYDYLIDDQLVPKGKGKTCFHTFWLQLTARKYCNRYVEHFQRILIHAAVCCLIYKAFGSNHVSFVAAVLFAVNPVNNNVVAWLNGVGYSVCALLALVMLILPDWSIIPYISTLWWHVTAFPAAFMFIMGNGQGIQPHYWQILSLVLYSGIMLAVKMRVPFGKVNKDATLSYRMSAATAQFKFVNLERLIFVVKSYAYYHWLVFIPKRFGLFHTFGYSYGLTRKDTDKWCLMSGLFLLGAGTIAAHVYIIMAFWGSPVAFGLFWFDLFIAQWCNFVILHQPITERYCYLPSIGLMYALVAGLYGFFVPEVADLLSVAIGTAYATKLFFYLPAYKNMEEYVKYNLHEFPDQFAAWNYAGVLQRDKGRIFSAMYHWAIGLRHDPTNFRLNFNMSIAFKQLGYFDQAQMYLKKAEEGLPPELYTKHKAILEKEKLDLVLAASGSKQPERMDVTMDGDKGGFRGKDGKGVGSTGSAQKIILPEGLR